MGHGGIASPQSSQRRPLLSSCHGNACHNLHVSASLRHRKWWLEGGGVGMGLIQHKGPGRARSWVRHGSVETIRRVRLGRLGYMLCNAFRCWICTLVPRTHILSSMHVLFKAASSGGDNSETSLALLSPLAMPPRAVVRPGAFPTSAGPSGAVAQDTTTTGTL